MMKIILASSHTEAVAYAKDQGWRSGTYRYPVKASTIKGLKVAEVHQLASFEKRFDRHTIMGVLRYARVPAWFLVVDGWTWPRRDPAPEQPELPFDDLLQPVPPLEGEITHAEFNFFDSLEDKEPKRPEPKPAAKPKRPRKPVPASAGFFDE